MRLAEGMLIIILTLSTIGLLILILNVKKETTKIEHAKEKLEKEMKGKTNSGVTSGEVFHISNNTHTYHTAEEKCKMYEARLATEEEIVKAYENGASWCNYGWSQGQKAMYPVQKKHYEEQKKFSKFGNPCRKVGVNGGYFPSPNHYFGVNCFGIKPKLRPSDLKERDRQDKLQEKREKILNQFNPDVLHREMLERKQKERMKELKTSFHNDVLYDFNQRKNQWSRHEK